MSELVWESPLRFKVFEDTDSLIGFVVRRTKNSRWVPYKANGTRIGWRMFYKPEQAQAEVEASFNVMPPSEGTTRPDLFRQASV